MKNRKQGKLHPNTKVTRRNTVNKRYRKARLQRRLNIFIAEQIEIGKRWILMLGSLIAITFLSAFSYKYFVLKENIFFPPVAMADAIVSYPIEVATKPTEFQLDNLPELPLKQVPNFDIDFISLSYAEKVNIIKERLAYKGVVEKDINIFVEIATLESCRDRGDHAGCMNPTKTPYVSVKHCLSASTGRWYVVEISASGGQAYCNAGDTEGRSEKSFGMYQILETTWEGYKCEGDRFVWYNQVDCAVKIRNRSGFNPWSTYKMINL